MTPDSDFVLDEQWYVQPSAYRVCRDDEVWPIGPRVMDVLVCLAAHPGEVVRRDTLMEVVWGDTVVVEEALTRCIGELRKLLGDDPRRPRVIETIRGAGYRLMVPVQVVVRPEAHGEPEALAVALPAPLQPGSARRPPSRPFRRAPASVWVVVGVALVALLVVTGLSRITPVVPATASPLLPPRVVPLTSQAGFELEPALSPDGRHVAYVSGDIPSLDLYVQPIAGGPARRLTQAPASDRSPAWSPDGRHIAFLRGDAEGCRLLLIAAAGGPGREIGPCGAAVAAGVSWSPDGRWVAVSEQRAPNEPRRLVLISPESGERRVATTPRRTTYGDYDPVFSPDGRDLVFKRVAFEETHDLYRVRLGGGEETRLTFDNRIVQGHTWTPDGSRIVFASRRGGALGLWSIPASGGAPEWLPVGAEHVERPHMARQAGTLVVQQAHADINVWSLPTTEGSREGKRRLIASTGHDLSPDVSPDGRRIAFVSDRSGSHEVWIADADGTNAQPATALNGPITGAPRWSPDGTRIAFESRPEGHVDLLVLDVASGGVRRLTTNRADDRAPTWSHDGRSVYFGSDRSGEWQIWAMPAGGGQARPVTTDGGIFAQESPDGALLYVARNDAPGLWRVPAEGGPATLLFEDTEIVDWANWRVAQAGIYVVQRAVDGLALNRIDPASGRAVTLRQIEGESAWSLPWSQPSLSISPNGREAVLAWTERAESDVLLIEGISPASR